MSKIGKYFKLAAEIACNGDRARKRRYKLGAVGVRNDGVIVASPNTTSHTPNPNVHAETRVCKKLTKDSIVYVVRISDTGIIGNARPCQHCHNAMKAKGVIKCYYSISKTEYGVIHFK